MPKAFNETEKEYIRNRLKEKGTELFLKYGIKKTTIDDLVKAVGISKGSFFAFYPNKEELFLEIFSETFNNINNQLREQLYSEKVSIKKAFSDFLRNRFTLKKNPLLAIFYNPDDFEYINRKITPDKLKEFIIKDFNELVSIITKYQAQRQIIQYNPKTIIEVFQALFYLSVQKHDLEKFNSFDNNIIDVFIEIIIDYFFNVKNNEK